MLWEGKGLPSWVRGGPGGAKGPGSGVNPNSVHPRGAGSS